MIRALFVLIAAVLYCIISIPILLVETIIRRFKPEAAANSMFRMVQGALAVLTFLSGAKVIVKGREHIPTDEAVLFVGNHQSFFDVIIGYPLMRRRTGYIAKKSIAKVPLLNWNMRFIGCLFLDREDPRQAMGVIKEEIQKIKDGTSIFVFPEGTRNRGNEENLAPFHKGSFKPAQRTGCKIVPVSFNNTAAVFEQHLPFVKAKTVVVEFGEPVQYTDLTKDEQKFIDVYFHDKIQEMVIKNQRLIAG